MLAIGIVDWDTYWVTSRDGDESLFVWAIESLDLVMDTL